MAYLAELQDAEVEILGVADVGGVIGKVIDSQTGVEDSTITPNDIIHIEGAKIKLEGDAPENGVYLIRQSDGTSINLQRIIKNVASELLVLLPNLEAGDYQLEIKTQYSGGGKTVNDSRTLSFDYMLTVL